MILHVLIAMVAGWIQRHQQRVITYLQEENRVLKTHLDSHQLRLTDAERRRLAALAHLLGRKRLKEIAAIATPDTLLRWYQRLIVHRTPFRDLSAAEYERRTRDRDIAALRKKATRFGFTLVESGLNPTLLL